ncbi:MAG: hypothetical protein ABI651_02030 [Verrucomicrobiota bacterium]
MLSLTRQQQLVLTVVLALLLVGWVVKVYRTATPSVISNSQPNH